MPSDAMGRTITYRRKHHRRLKNGRITTVRGGPMRSRPRQPRETSVTVTNVLPSRAQRRPITAAERRAENELEILRETQYRPPIVGVRGGFSQSLVDKVKGSGGAGGGGRLYKSETNQAPEASRGVSRAERGSPYPTSEELNRARSAFKELQYEKASKAAAEQFARNRTFSPEKSKAA